MEMFSFRAMAIHCLYAVYIISLITVAVKSDCGAPGYSRLASLDPIGLFSNNSYPDGHKVRYICRSQLVGSQIRTCMNNSWHPFIPKCPQYRKLLNPKTVTDFKKMTVSWEFRKNVSIIGYKISFFVYDTKKASKSKPYVYENFIKKVDFSRLRNSSVFELKLRVMPDFYKRCKNKSVSEECTYGTAQVYTLDFQHPDECVKPDSPINGLAYATWNGTDRVSKYGCNDGYQLSGNLDSNYCPKLGDWLRSSNGSYMSFQCVSKVLNPEPMTNSTSNETLTISKSDNESLKVKLTVSKVLNILLFFVITLVVLTIVAFKVRDNRRNKKFLEKLRQNSTSSTRYESAYVYEKTVSYREEENPAYESLKLDMIPVSSLHEEKN